MQEEKIGDIIRNKRDTLGYTQQKLCEGVCSYATLSRIENGNQCPSKHVVDALLERLGLPDDKIFIIINHEEEKIEELCAEISKLNIKHNKVADVERQQIKDEILDKLKKLELMADKNNLLIKQFILRIRANIADDFYNQTNTLLQALKITFPNFDLKHIADNLYTFDEIKIINHLAGLYRRNGDTNLALSIMSQLHDYIIDHYREMPARAHLSMVTLNYAILLYDLGLYEKAMMIAQEGKEICVNYNSYECMGDLLEIEAKCQKSCGSVEIANELLLQAFYLYKVTKNELGMKRIKSMMNESEG